MPEISTSRYMIQAGWDDGKQVLNGEREPAAQNSKLAELEARAKERQAGRAAA